MCISPLDTKTHINPSENSLHRVKCHKIMIYPQPIRRHYHPKYTLITLAPVSYLRSLVVRAVHRHRTGIGSIPAGGPYIVDEYFSTVPRENFVMCISPLDTKTHINLSENSLKQALTWCLISNEPSFPTVLRSAFVDLVPVLACDVEPLARGGKFSLTVVFPGEQYAHGMFEGVRLLTVTVTSTLPSNQLRDEPLASNCSTTAVLQKSTNTG